MFENECSCYVIRNSCLVLTSVFPSFSVTCLCLTCSDKGRSNPIFVFIVLLALCMPFHITPIFNPVYKAFLFIPCFDQIHLIGFYFVTCCFNIFICIKTRVLSLTPHTNSRRSAALLETSNLFVSLR